MLQKIFGGSESEESEPIPKKQRRLNSDTEAMHVEKPSKPSKELIGELEDRVPLDQEDRTVATSPPPADLHVLTTSPMLLQPKIPLNRVVLSPKHLPPPPAEPVKRPVFKARCLANEEWLARGLRDDPPDREDIVMLRLALGRLRGEGEELVGRVGWAYHPHDIHSYIFCFCLIVVFLIV